MRYEMLLRTSEKVAAEEAIEADLATAPPEETQPGPPKSPASVAAKEVKRLRAQTEGAKAVIAKVMNEDVKIRTEIAEGTYSWLSPLWLEAD